MLEPEVQQLHNVGPTVARRRVPDVIFFLYLSIVFCLGFPILPYALSFIGILSLGPCILFDFFRGSTPPWQQTMVLRQINMICSQLAQWYLMGFNSV